MSTWIDTLGTGDARCPFCGAVINLGSLFNGKVKWHIDGCEKALKHKAEVKEKAGEK